MGQGIWDDIIGVVGAVAPTIASMLGGPMAGAAVGALSEAVLGRADGAAGEISAAILGGLKPEQVAALREAEQKMAVELARLAVESEKIAAGDRADARSFAREEIKSEDVFVRRFRYYFAAATMFASFIYIYLISFMPIPETSVRFVDTVQGFLLATVVAVIMQFFYGSSESSKAKTAMLGRMAGK